ncbi:MAG: 50S ribosomal protein L9 [Clostridia bacterium]|nr:50S ribosomal protein L9 [Clostridia bacterium]
MKVILLADIKGVGKKDEVINASDGYARNFLFPKNLALEANKENMAKLKSKNDAKAYQKEMDIKAAKEVAEKINSITMKLEVKAGENGKIFGGVTAKEIAENLKKEYKIDIDKKKVLLSETIKTIGVHNIEIKLYEGIIAKLKLNVVS